MHRRLGEILLASGIIEQAQLDEALGIAQSRGLRLGEALVELGLVTPEQLAFALADQLDLPVVSADELLLDEARAAMLPYGYLESHKCLPIILPSGVPVLAMADPLDLRTLDFVRQTTGGRIEPAVAAVSDITNVLVHRYGKRDQMEMLVRELGTRDDFTFVETKVESEITAEAASETAPAVQIVSTIIADSIEAGASDIHIEPRPDGVQVRMRVDGKLRDSAFLPSFVHASVISRIKIMADMDIAEKRAPQDGHIRAVFKDRGVDLRVSTIPTSDGEKAVLRILDRASGPVGLDQVGFMPMDLQVFTDALDLPQGMVLVTGPTGSGKTTTLYAALDYIQDETRNIVTIEDPIERHISGINQMQVLEAAGVTFASGLRAIVRQDPDVIMVGEIRDGETAEIAMRSALTGHLVLSTLHTNDAVSTVTRLVDLGIEPYLISSSVILITAQRLVRTCCKYCLTEYMPPKSVIAKAEQELGSELSGPFRHGVGCERCGMRGYLGRSVVYEMLPITEAVRQLIALEAREHVVLRQAMADGMTSMFELGIQRVKAGVTTLEEVVYTVPPHRRPTEDEAVQPRAPQVAQRGSSAQRGRETAEPSIAHFGVPDTDGLVLYIPKSLSTELLARLHVAGLIERATTSVPELAAAEKPVELGLEQLIQEVQAAMGPDARLPRRRGRRADGAEPTLSLVKVGSRPEAQRADASPPEAATGAAEEAIDVSARAVADEERAATAPAEAVWPERLAPGPAAEEAVWPEPVAPVQEPAVEYAEAVWPEPLAPVPPPKEAVWPEPVAPVQEPAAEYAEAVWPEPLAPVPPPEEAVWPEPLAPVPAEPAPEAEQPPVATSSWAVVNAPAPPPAELPTVDASSLPTAPPGAVPIPPFLQRALDRDRAQRQIIPTRREPPHGR